jgi:BirA family biotin operon repressor/biotin-[acetyl-CoA-carboxylase] ligase
VLAALEADKGRYVSGTGLAESTSVSRTAIWKAIRSLRKSGYVIDACPKRGYMLQPEKDVISEFSIKKFMHFYADEITVRAFGRVSSTNTVARNFAKRGLGQYTAIVAEEQTEGRGTHGRKFFSPSGTGLYMSIILRPDTKASDTTYITTAAAAACAEAIESVFGVNVFIKWVNDIYFNDKKVCGILTEGSFDPDGKGIEYAVLGIGVNVFRPVDDFPDELRGMAHWLADEPLCDIRSRLAAEILDRFIFYYKRLPEMAFMRSYKRRMFLTGREVEISYDGKKTSAYVLGLTDDLRLEVKLKNGEIKKLSSGDVKLKVKQMKISDEDADE